MDAITTPEVPPAITLADAQRVSQHCEQSVSDARAAHTLAEERLEACDRERSEAQRALQLVDPDNSGALRKLSAEHATLEAKRVPLAARAQLAEDTLGEALRALEAAEQKREEAETAHRAAQRAQAEERLRKQVAAFDKAAASDVALLQLDGAFPLDAVAVWLQKERADEERDRKHRHLFSQGGFTPMR